MVIEVLRPGTLADGNIVFHNLLPTFVVGHLELFDALIQHLDLLVRQSLI